MAAGHDHGLGDGADLAVAAGLLKNPVERGKLRLMAPEVLARPGRTWSLDVLSDRRLSPAHD
jgi:hypothetical protein